MTSKRLIYPIDSGLPFLIWIEDIRNHLPDGSIFTEAQSLHSAYKEGGLNHAIRWLEHIVKHPTGKGEPSPSSIAGLNHFIIALWELGLNTDKTHTATRRLIEQREE